MSKAEVGSSSNNIFDLRIRARISDILCFYPPEKMLPFSPTFVSYFYGNCIIVSWSLSFLVNYIIYSSEQCGLPNLRFSMTVPWKRQGFCETNDIWLRKLKLTSLSLTLSISIYPQLGSYSLKIKLSMEVLPIPLRPMTAVNEFLSILNDKLLKILFDQFRYRKLTSLNYISPFICCNYFAPYRTKAGVFIIDVIFQISIKLSLNERYIDPRKKRGLRNCSISDWMSMISPIVSRPIFVQQAASIMLKVNPVPKIHLWTVFKMPRVRCTSQLFSQYDSKAQ